MNKIAVKDWEDVHQHYSYDNVDMDKTIFVFPNGEELVVSVVYEEFLCGCCGGESVYYVNNVEMFRR